MLVDRIKMLCDERGETLASLERKMDFGNGTIRRWDNTTPSGDKLAKVADFFHVSVDYILDREQREKPAQNVQTRPRLRSVARLEESSITPEQDEEISHYIDFLLNKKKGN